MDPHALGYEEAEWFLLL